MKIINSEALENREQFTKNATAENIRKRKRAIVSSILSFFAVALIIVYIVYFTNKAPFIAVMEEEIWNWIFFAILGVILIVTVISRKLWERKVTKQDALKESNPELFDKEPD